MIARGPKGILVLVLVAACGSGTPHTTAPGADETAPPDPAKLVRTMRDSAGNGGLWFDDPGCAKQFGVAGEVEGERLSAFASCLEGLRLELSPRKSMLPDVVVLRYPPGFEVEARVVRDDGALRLTWIGFASRRAGDLDVPTITHDALESLRLAGRRDGPIDPAVTGSAWVKLCIDGAGAIAKTMPFETTSLEMTKAALAAIASWKFRPFVTRGQPLPACALVRISSPVDDRVETLALPPPKARSGHEAVVFAVSARAVEKRLVTGTTDISPDDITKHEIHEARDTLVTGQFRICVDEQGAVEQVMPLKLTRYPAYDKTLTTAMHDWRFQPLLVDGHAVPFCMYIQVLYSQG